MSRITTDGRPAAENPQGGTAGQGDERPHPRPLPVRLYKKETIRVESACRVIASVMQSRRLEGRAADTKLGGVQGGQTTSVLVPTNVAALTLGAVPSTMTFPQALANRSMSMMVVTDSGPKVQLQTMKCV